MTYFQIYENALNYLGEPKHSEATADYFERAPALITAVNGILYSEIITYDPQNKDSEPRVCESIDSTYPYDVTLAPIVSLMLAAVLIADSRLSTSEAYMNAAKLMIKSYRKKFNSVGSISEVYPS